MRLKEFINNFLNQIKIKVREISLRIDDNFPHFLNSLTVIVRIIFIFTFFFITLNLTLLPKSVWYQCKLVNNRKTVVIVTAFSGENSEIDTRIFSSLSDRIQSSNSFDIIDLHFFENISPMTNGEAYEIAEKCSASILIWGISDYYGVDVSHITNLISITDSETEEYTERDLPNLAQSVPSLEENRIYIQSSIKEQFDYLMLIINAQILLLEGNEDTALPLLTEAVYLGEDLLISFESNEYSIDNKKPYLCMRCTYFYRAIANYRLGYFEEAIQDTNNMIAINPTDAQALYLQGYVYYLMNHPEDALTTINHAINLNEEGGLTCSRLPQLYNLRGAVYFTLDEENLAIQDLRKAIVLDPDSPYQYYNLASIYYNQQRPDLSLPSIDKSIDINPKHSESYFLRGLVFYSIGEFKKAYEDFDQAIELGFQTPDAYARRGGTLVRLGKYSKAIRDFRKSVELDPTFSRAYLYHGNALMKQGKYEDANQYFELAIANARDSIYAYQYLAQSYAELGDYESAINSLERAVNQGLDRIQILISEAEINKQFIRYDQAKNNYLELIEITSPDSLEHINAKNELEILQKTYLDD